MGLFKRLHRITVGRVVHFLERLEDPEIIFPQLLRELQQQLIQAAEQEAGATSAVRRAELDVDRTQQRIDSLGEGARLSLDQDDDQTARDALSAQIDAEETLATCQSNLEILRDTLEYVRSAREQLEQQLAELRARKDEILTRSRVVRARKRIQLTVTGSVGSSESILDAVARMELSVDQAEAELEIQSRLVGEDSTSPSLDRRLRELHRNTEIERRLGELRRPQTVAAGQ
jgi:phage shock protein A